MDDEEDSLMEGEGMAGIVKRDKMYEMMRCRYTDRVLKPVIFQDWEVVPPRVRLHEELWWKTRIGEGPPPHRLPLDYVYLRAEYVEAASRLVETHFWVGAGAEVKPALAYPEFTCLALYGKVLVGLGLLSPGPEPNQAYLSFLVVRPQWRRCGIASFILYHLLNTCLSWDLTLHVSSTNPSIFLYHTFGFKTHRLLHNFYHNYLPSSSTQALLLKLER